MFISSEIRRDQLKLWNVSEVARLLDVEIGWLHRKLKENKLPNPTVQLKKTLYYNEDGIASLKKAIVKMD